MSPRPKSDRSKNMRFEIRLTQETLKTLEECAKKLHTTKTGVVLKGIDLVKSELDKQK